VMMLSPTFSLGVSVPICSICLPLCLHRL
jgi:hypothetical protein